MTADDLSALRAEIAEALRQAAFDCPSDCGKTEAECDAEHPIQVWALHFGQVASVYGDIDALAEAVLPVLARLAQQRDQAREALAERKRAALALAEHADQVTVERDEWRDRAVKADDLWLRATAKRDRYRSAWRSARRRAGAAGRERDEARAQVEQSHADLAETRELLAMNSRDARAAIRGGARVLAERDAARADAEQLRAGLEAMWQRWFMNTQPGVAPLDMLRGIGGDIGALLDNTNGTKEGLK